MLSYRKIENIVDLTKTLIDMYHNDLGVHSKELNHEYTIKRYRHNSGTLIKDSADWYLIAIHKDSRFDDIEQDSKVILQNNQLGNLSCTLLDSTYVLEMNDSVNHNRYSLITDTFNDGVLFQFQTVQDDEITLPLALECMLRDHLYGLYVALDITKLLKMPEEHILELHDALKSYLTAGGVGC